MFAALNVILCIGYLGELTLIIPWSNLRNEPVKVIIDHVYLLAEPKNESTVSDQTVSCVMFLSNPIDRLLWRRRKSVPKS